MTSIEEQRKPLQKIRTTIMENSMKFPQKTEKELPYDQQSYFWVCMPREWDGYARETLHFCDHCSIIHNSQDTEAT
jgi:hypothetical protein